MHLGASSYQITYIDDDILIGRQIYTGGQFVFEKAMDATVDV